MATSEYRPAQLKRRKNEKDHDKRWQPTKWKPEYEVVLSLHVRGKTNKEIASITRYTPVQICNILNCDYAKTELAKYSQAIKEDTEDDIKYIEKKAVGRIKEMVDNDALFESSPFGVVDRSLTFLKGTSKLAPDVQPGSLTQQNNQFNIFNNELGEKLLNGLNKANQAAALNSGVTGDSIN